MRKVSTVIFNDKMALKEVILSNKNFRLFLADCFSLLAKGIENKESGDSLRRSLNRFKKKELEYFNKYPLLQTPAVQPLYLEFYRSGKQVLRKYVYLSSMTPERKKLSEDIYIEHQIAGIPKGNPALRDLNSLKEELKYFYQDYQDEALRQQSDVTRNDFLLDEEDFQIIPDKIFTYLSSAFDKKSAYEMVGVIFRQGAKFYASTNGSDIFIPDTSGFEPKYWKGGDIVWKTAINKAFYGYGDLKIIDIRDLIDFNETSLMKFKSFYENLSTYKPKMVVPVNEETTLSDKIKEKAPILEVIEKDKVISTKGIYQIIREKTSPILKSYGSIDSNTYAYSISEDGKTITYSFGFYSSSSGMRELKNKILSSFQRKSWSSLFSISIDYFQEGDVGYVFDVSITANKGYKFHPYENIPKGMIDIETKEVSSSTFVPSDEDMVEIPVDQLIPPPELSLDKKIEFVLKLNPNHATCQVCGGDFNLTKKGLIQTHGYSFAWGKLLGKTEGSECEGSGALPSQFSKDQTIFEISRLNQLVYKMGKSPSSFSQKELDSLDSLKDQLKRLEEFEKKWVFSYYNPSIRDWVGTKYPIGLSNDDYIETEGTKETSEAILKLGNFKLIFVSEINLEEIIRIREAFERAIKLIKESPLKKFKNSLRGRVFVGKSQDLKRRMIVQSTSRLTLASYSSKRGYICFFTDDVLARLTSHERTSDVIHEFGHKFHNEDLPDFFKNQSIIDLYNTDKSDRCISSNLPSKGDLLSDFDLPGNVHISSSNDGFVCIGFKGRKGEGAKYVFENPKTKEQKIVDEEYFIISIKCPSSYGSENLEEWFAEMTVAVTGDVARIPNKAISKKFVQIVNSF